MRKNASANPLRPAIVGPNLTLSNEELLESAFSVANWLRLKGIGAGSRVAVKLSPETECVFLVALDALGATACVVRSLRQIERLGELEIDLLIVSKALEKNLAIQVEHIGASSIPQVEPSDDFQEFQWQGDEGYRMLFTSGTTGAPKAVLLTSGIFHKRVERIRSTWHQNEPLLLLIGMDSSMAQFTLTHALDRASTYLIPHPSQMLFTFLKTWGIKTLAGSENQLLGISSIASSPIASVERVLVTGSFPSERLFGAVARSFPNAELHIFYGSTETGTVFMGQISEGETHLGFPVADDEITIDSTGFESEQEGLLVIKSSVLPDGYLADPKANAKHFTKAGFIPGDLVRKEVDGKFIYLGRSDSLLNLGGVKINPENLERYAESQYPGFLFLLRLNDGELELRYQGDKVLDELEIITELKARFGSAAPTKALRVESIEVTDSGKKVRI